MARAAAKKAAAAKAAATSTYQPILWGTNAVYLICFWLFRRRRDFETSLFSWGTIAVHLLLGGLQYYAYLGLTDSTSSSSSLDLLVVTLLIQFAGAFLSSYAYYGLILVFVWGGWTTYRMFRPATPATPADANATETSSVDAEKKQRRAERRRQKRISSDDDGGDATEVARKTSESGGSGQKTVSKQTKVLKLASILPPEVLQRLEQNDDQSSSDEEDERSAKHQTKSNTGASALLASLQSIKPKRASPFPVSAFSNNSKSTSQLPQPPPAEQLPRSEQKDTIPANPIAPSNTNSVSSVGRHVVAAAPRVRAAPSATAYPNPNPSVPPPHHSATHSSSSAPTPLPTANSRKTRQNLERELRSGNMGAITTPHSHARTVIGDTSAVRVVDYASAQTIRSVPEGVYDPVTGKLSAAGKRGAGKNQVHVLVHQAAALERQRAEQNNSNSTLQQRRADSKRKYGW